MKQALTAVREGLLFQSKDFDPSAKQVDILDHSAAQGDMHHFICHGITFGSMLYKARRSDRWRTLSEQVYQNGKARGMATYCYPSAGQMSEIYVLGRKFLAMTVEGESCRKDIFYSNIVQIGIQRPRPTFFNAAPPAVLRIVSKAMQERRYYVACLKADEQTLPALTGELMRRMEKAT